MLFLLWMFLNDVHMHHLGSSSNITMAPYWAQWRLKSPASRCLLKRLFRYRSKKTSKLRVIGLCAGNSPATGEFPAQRASNADNGSTWRRHHEGGIFLRNEAYGETSCTVPVTAVITMYVAGYRRVRGRISLISMSGMKIESLPKFIFK